jgi:transketolase
VKIPSIIGYPAPNAQDTAKAHGSPLGTDEVAAAKDVMGWDAPAFTVPDEVAAHMDQRERGAQTQRDWEKRFAAYEQAHPELAAEFRRLMAGELPEGWDADLPTFEAGSAQATRKSSAAALNHFAARLPELIGGSADLAGSNLTTITDGGDISAERFDGRNIHFGIREHAMGSMMNGMVLHGGIRPFGGTFLIFTDYLRPSLRLACLMGLPVIYVMTHDSIGLGEDGPTHQPVEHLAALRAIPNLHVMRPADARETLGRVAARHRPHRRADAARPHAAERPRARGHRAGGRGGRRLHRRRGGGSRCRARGDRQRGPRRRRGCRDPRRRRHRRAGGVDAVLGAVRGPQ